MANMESDGLRAGSHGEHGLDQCDCPHAHCIHVTARCRDDHCQAQLSKKYTILETRVAGLQSKQHGILQEFAAFGGDVDELSAEVVGSVSSHPGEAALTDIAQTAMRRLERGRRRRRAL